MDYLKQVKRAYRKLKGSVYLDKTMAILRNNIVEFEDSNIERSLETISNKLLLSDNEWEYYVQEILDSVKVFSFPKKVIGNKDGENEKDQIKIITNKPINNTYIKKYNNFIDMKIDGHILGVLWILSVGVKLDNDLLETCYGNRLYENLKNEEENETTSSPNLMKPYFKQYESWRDNGLKIAEDFIKENGKNIVIMMLDLSMYYYKVNLSYDKYYMLTSDAFNEESLYEKRLNDFVYKVFLTYTQFFKADAENAFLPIGFLPSNIMGNYYLKEFDEDVITEFNPLYYGRYVDDMIIVSQVDNKAKIIQELENYKLDIVINNMLDLFCDKNIFQRQKSGSYELYKYEGLKIQKGKFRFFYLDKEGSSGIIDSIRRDIANNTSEFNFMPVDDDDIGNDYNNIYKFDREDSVNKIRAINSVQIGKYELSKMIARHLTISKFDESDSECKFLNEIDNVFDSQTILNNYTIWENLFNYYVVNDCLDKMVLFIEKIIYSIRQMDEDTFKRGEYKPLSKNNILSVSESLIIYLIACLARSLSIVWGDNVKICIFEFLKVINKFEDDKGFVITSKQKIDILRNGYCESRMISKYLIPITIEECINTFKTRSDDNELKMYSIKEYLKMDSSQVKKNVRYLYNPYIITPFEIAITYTLKSIKEGKNIPGNVDLTKKIIKCYGDNFWDNNKNSNYFNNHLLSKPFAKCKSDDKNFNVIQCCADKNKGKYKIAVANVKINIKDFEAMLLDKAHDKRARYREIAIALNEAIKYKVDVLIMPESFVPIEYLEQIQRKVSMHNIIVVCGIEHIKVVSGQKPKIYNLMTTILPMKTEKYSYAIPYFHQKVYFSPTEKAKIEDYGFIAMEGNEYTLYNCKDLWFVPYCCYELTSIKERSIFQSYADLIIGVEWNKDTKYFGNIIESLSRDLHCFCAQSNTSEYGDSRVTQPTKSYKANIIQVKGGINTSILIGEIDVNLLREFQLKGVWCQNNDDNFKTTPPNINKSIIYDKLHGRLFDRILNDNKLN
jgi:hypothetical protein